MATLTHIHFDFFGTLVNYSKGHRAESHQKSYRILADREAGLTYESYLVEWNVTFEKFARRADESLVEFSMDELCMHFLKAHLQDHPGPELVEEFRDIYLDEWSMGVSYIRGLDLMLDSLASRYRLSVVSNTSHQQLVSGLLEKARIRDFFQDITTSVEYGRRKPCPTIYQHALTIAGARPDRTLFVGDSFEPDYSGPRAIGLRALLIDPGCREQIPDEHRLHNILDLREQIAVQGYI